MGRDCAHPGLGLAWLGSTPAIGSATLMTQPQSRSIGDNGGPPLEEEDREASWRLWCWRRAHRRAWKTSPREIALRRLARTEEPA